MKDLVLLRLKKIILMILLQTVMMLMKLFRELSVAFRKDTGLADVNENYSKDTPHDNERKYEKEETIPDKKLARVRRNLNSFKALYLNFYFLL